MEITSKYLPGPGTVISESWKLFVSTWKQTVKVSALLLIPAAVAIAAFYFFEENWGVLTLVGFLALLSAMWIVIRLALTLLKLEAGQQPLPGGEESKRATSLFLSNIWVVFLNLIIVLGGTILFILPGVYLSIALTFSQMVLFDKGAKGLTALSASRQLVKGRWWDTFFNLTIGGFVFAALMQILQLLGVLIFALILGLKKVVTTDDPLDMALMQLISMLVVVAFMPLALSLQVKLYRIMQKTR